MILGYVTNGFAHHTLDGALELLAGLGYRAVGLTLDANHFDPFAYAERDLVHLRARLQELGLSCAIETGARYLLDPRRKHEPSLVSAEAAGRERRLDYYRRAIRIGAALGARVLSLWSGTLAPGVERERAWSWLVAGCRETARRAADAGMVVGFEPEPGMLVERLDGYRALAAEVDRPAFRLTLDVGHLACVEEPPLDLHVRQAKDVLAHVHLDDIRGRVHEHRAFGEGEIAFPPLFAALREIGYEGLALVELSRDSHRAPEVAEAAIRFLAPLVG